MVLSTFTVNNKWKKCYSLLVIGLDDSLDTKGIPVPVCVFIRYVLVLSKVFVPLKSVPSA